MRSRGETGTWKLLGGCWGQSLCIGKPREKKRPSHWVRGVTSVLLGKKEEEPAVHGLVEGAWFTAAPAPLQPHPRPTAAREPQLRGFSCRRYEEQDTLISAPRSWSAQRRRIRRTRPLALRRSGGTARSAGVPGDALRSRWAAPHAAQKVHVPCDTPAGR